MKTISLKKVISLASFVLVSAVAAVNAQNWTFMKGYLVHDAPWHSTHPFPAPNSVHGPSMVFDASYKPSAREHCGGGIKGGNEIWMFGGINNDGGMSSDMWVFDIAQNKWAWVEDRGAAPNYTDFGVESATAHPGLRRRAATAMDASGNIWLFGGEGYSTMVSGYSISRNDVWKYNTTTRKWTWVAGPSVQGDPGSSTLPSARHRVRGWFDNAGNFWVFGGCYGQVIDSRTGVDIEWPDPSAWGYEINVGYNDLWKFNVTTKVWTCESGTPNAGRAINSPSGSYPSSVGMSSTTYLPRARADYGWWKDNSDNFWFFGGYSGEAHAGGVQSNCDMWKYTPSTHVWTLMSGSQSTNTPQSTTDPGTLVEPLCWLGNDGNPWMYNGQSQTVWKFNATTNVWQAVDYRTTTSGASPVSAGEGIETTTNLPGTQVTTFCHVKTANHVYFFNGFGRGTNSDAPGIGLTGALWRYGLIPGCTVPSAPSISSSVMSLCTGGSTTLTASGCSGGTINWTGGGTGPTKVVTSPGTYQASCTLAGCTSTLANIVIAAGTAPSAPSVITSTGTTLCYGTSTTIAVSGCSGGTVKWSDGVVGASRTITSPGTYLALCEVGGCQSSQSWITVTSKMACSTCTSSTGSTPAPSTYFGDMGTPDCSGIYGYALNSANPNQNLELDLFINGYYAGTTTAYISIPATYDGGLASTHGDTKFGYKHYYFNLASDSWYRSGTTYTCQIRYKGTNTPLPLSSGATNTFNCSGTGTGSCYTTTGLSTLSNFSSLIVYPNPANDQISVVYQNGSIEAVKVVIINLLGQTIITSKTFTNIDIKDLANGNYFINVIGKNNEVLSSSKFVKE